MSGSRRAQVAVAGLLAVLCAACGPSPADAPADPAGSTASTDVGAGQGPELFNEEWHLLKMALAHGVMVIEIEAVDPTRALELAHVLRAPLGEQYGEVLVYVQQMGEGDAPPVRRVRWTKQAGYEELVY